MKITERNVYPVQYEDVLVFPEYYTNKQYGTKTFNNELLKYRGSETAYYVVGVGKSYKPRKYTTVLLLDRTLKVIGVRQKISIFLGEASKPSLKLQAFRLTKDRILGIVVCKEVLHTAIAEVYRMMGVNLLAVTIGSGQFWDLQRQSWIDQLSLFSDICQAPLVCACGATKDEGGINLIIERMPK
jgi:predicted amidohydrolase